MNGVATDGNGLELCSEERLKDISKHLKSFVRKGDEGQGGEDDIK